MLAELQLFDKRLTILLRRCLHCSVKASTNYLHTARYMGGPGVKFSKLLQCQIKVCGLLKLLNNNKGLSSITRERMLQAIGMAYSGGIPLGNALDYLNGRFAPRISSHRAWWTKSRSSISTLSKFGGSPLKFGHNVEDETFFLSANGIKIENPRFTMKAHIHEKTFAKWEAQANQLCNEQWTIPAILEQSLITPSCGTGSLSPDLAEKVLALTSEVSATLRDKYLS